LLQKEKGELTERIHNGIKTPGILMMHVASSAKGSIAMATQSSTAVSSAITVMASLSDLRRKKRGDKPWTLLRY
jgi:hypothetical protein